MGRFLIWAIVAVVGLGLISSLTRRSDDPTPVGQATATPSENADESSSPPSEAAADTPAPELTAAPTLAPAFEAIALSGVGPGVPQFTIPEDQAAIATFTHQGASNFSVLSIGADGTQQELLVNTIGSYSGTVLFDASTGEHSVAFEIDADGPWSATVKSIADAQAWDPSVPMNGMGDDVVRLSPASSALTTLHVIHDGASNFAVVAYSESGADLLVNEIGAYTADVLLPPGTFLLEISADGAWSVTPS